jgi:hypothetical protein
VIWTSIAWAGPPEGVVPDDLERWEAGAEQVLAGPPGCWILGGGLSIRLAGLRAATGSGRADAAEDRFVGRFEGLIEGGEWKNLSYSLSPADDPTKPAEVSIPMLPTIGRFSPAVMHRVNPADKESMTIGVDGGASNLIARVFEDISAGGTVYAQWDEVRGGIELFQDVAIRDRPKSEPVQVRTFFPGGGPASAVDVTFPRRLRDGAFPIWVTLHDLQMHLKTAVVDGAVLPAADSVSFGVSTLGMTFGFDQTLTWERAARCAE